MKYFFPFFLLFLASTMCYSQKEINKNGQKINKLDKKSKKQGSWFFFNQLGDLQLSCYYKNDSIVTPIVFYEKNDSAFVRFPKVDKSEIFLLKNLGKWVVGTIQTINVDSTKIEILGRYIKQGKDKFDIQDDEYFTNSPSIKKEAELWCNKEIQPIYLFGTEEIRDFYYRIFNSSKIVFNKNIVVELSLNDSGVIKKINFPGNYNNLNLDEVSELSYLFSKMERWQPFFSKNRTLPYTARVGTNAKIK